MPRKQRRRPDAGLEIVYADEHYSAILVSDPESDEQHIRVYSQPYHKLMFKVHREGLKLWCKRCRDEHLMAWDSYSLWVQRPYATLPICPLDSVAFSYALRKATHREFELIEKLRNLT
jgi:hypothetical protein